MIAPEAGPYSGPTYLCAIIFSPSVSISLVVGKKRQTIRYPR